MDTPNAPNPANPNAQGQNADAEPGPANQVQGPAVQNQAQGPVDHNQVQVPIGQVPAQVPVQVVQNVPVDRQPLPTNSPYATGPCWYHAHSSDFLSKLDGEESRIFR